MLTYTPNNPILFRVEYGNIGRAYNTWRYSVPSAAPTGGTNGAPPTYMMPPPVTNAPAYGKKPSQPMTKPGY
ncbi:MAG: hypothetical protein ACYDAR_14625 [Thermomicrobiales bacterium]